MSCIGMEVTIAKTTKGSKEVIIMTFSEVEFEREIFDQEWE